VCIDKSSSAELSEAINSMFQWYRAADICYAYLADVKHYTFTENLPCSRWFTRGWTLQELIAPKQLMFYDATWTSLGSKTQHAHILESITKIDRSVLVQDPYYLLHGFSVAQRMAWVSERKTTRAEDMAYCLLGIFDVNMPLLYGEGGPKAFLRLQQDIIKAVDDDSIFAWSLQANLMEPHMAGVIAESNTDLLMDSILAGWPTDFKNCHNITVIKSMSAYTMTNMGLEMELPLIDGVGKTGTSADGPAYFIGLLTCKLPGIDAILGMLLAPVAGSDGLMRRFTFQDTCQERVEMISTFAVGPRLAMRAMPRKVTIIRSPWMIGMFAAQSRLRKFIVNPSLELAGFQYYITRVWHLRGPF
jgi:hypothetical protein